MNPSAGGVFTPDAFETRAVQALREGGLRITSPRLHVIRKLSQSSTALTANQIHDQILADGDQVDLVTVYRILSTLMELHLVHHIGVVDAYTACDLESHGNNTEHLICTKCGSVQELDAPGQALEATRAQLQTLGFNPDQIKIEITGECQKCHN